MAEIQNICSSRVKEQRLAGRGVAVYVKKYLQQNLAEKVEDVDKMWSCRCRKLKLSDY
jgi:hypothetical protein